MNIKNQIRLSVLISLILVVVISVSIIVSYQHMQVLQRQESLAADVVRGGYELTYLSNDYLINAEPRARVQWEERYTSLQPILSQLKSENADEAQNLAIIREYNEKTGVLFREIPEPKTLSAGSVLFPTSYQQVTWSRINVQSQGMIYEAWHLRQLYNHDVSEARFWNNILVLVLMVLMLVIIGVNYLLISRRLVRSIREVNEGSEVFATGNLDYRIPVKRDDEIGGIAHRLNLMAEQIRAVTASRDELDREITDRKRAEEALLESEEKYREFFTTSRDCVFITSPEGTWIDFNDAAMEMFGYDIREEFAQMPVKDLYFIDGERAAFTSLILQEGFVKEYPVRLKRKDKTILNTLITAAPLRNPDDSIKAFIGTIRDVTQQKRAEEQVKTSETRYRRLFESAKDGILILNRDTGKIIDANPFIESLLGYAPQDLLGKHLWDIGLFNDQVLSKIAFEDLQKKEYLRYEDLPLETLGGQRIDVEFVSNVYPVDATTTVIQCSIRDISDRKRTEVQREMLITQLEQKNTELERFTYTVSHDLKSPLITIQGFAGLLEDDALNGDQLQMKKDIHRITAAADIMQTLLADLIELSRVGKIINPLQKIPFGTIVNEAVDLLAGPLAKRNVTVDVASSLPVVNVDHTRIREVMINLIENALKYLGDQTDPVIRIGADMNGETMVFFVQDNGIGIDSRYLERIFNLFERLDASEQGTGIGLTIVRQIIEVHGGKIWAESDGAGKGTTFRFTLPGPAEDGLRGI
jgi:PAS domain S-box-containing protein